MSDPTKQPQDEIARKVASDLNDKLVCGSWDSSSLRQIAAIISTAYAPLVEQNAELVRVLEQLISWVDPKYPPKMLLLKSKAEALLSKARKP